MSMFQLLRAGKPVAGQDRPEAGCGPKSGRRRYNALATLIAAAILSLVLSFAAVVQFNLSWLWFVPIYGLVGAVLVGLLAGAAYLFER